MLQALHGHGWSQRFDVTTEHHIDGKDIDEDRRKIRGGNGYYAQAGFTGFLRVPLTEMSTQQ